MTRIASTKTALVLGLIAALGCGHSQEASANPPGAGGGASQASAEEQPTVTAAGSTTVKGTVKFTGTPPAAERVKMDADPQCQMQHKDPVQKQDVVVNGNGTLRHVFVYVKDGAVNPPPAPSTPVTLDQQGCMYAPHVLGIQVNQPLQIANSDATLHNVNCKPAKSKPFNLAQPTKGMKHTKQFTAPEIMVKCACNVHPWMIAYIGVVEHPYFSTTGEDGSFSIAGLPAGTYTLEAWHETYGTRTQQITVADGQTAEAVFEFNAQ